MTRLIELWDWFECVATALIIGVLIGRCDAYARGPYRGDRARPVRVFKHLRFKSSGRCKVNGEWIKGCS